MVFGIDDLIVGAVIAGVGANSAHQANKANENIMGSANEFNSAEAMYNREFQATMRATQYQTAVNDMALAGLNPMLAYHNGGAGTPSGSAASSVSPPKINETLGPAINSAMQFKTSTQALENMKADQELKEAQAFQARAEGWAAAGKPANIEADTYLKRQQAGGVDVQNRTTFNTGTLVAEQAKAIGPQMDLVREQIKNTVAQTQSEQERTRLIRAQQFLTDAEERYTNGKIGIQEFTKAIESAEADLRSNMRVGSAEEAQHQRVWGQLQRILKTLNPLSAITIGR